MNSLGALLLLSILLFGTQGVIEVRGSPRLAPPSSEVAGLFSLQLPLIPLAVSGCTPKGTLVPIVLSYVVVGGGSGYTAPTLNFVVNKTSYSVALTTTPTTYYMDPKTNWHTTNLLPGSQSTERWATSQAVGGTANQCVTIALQYNHQFLTDFEFLVKGGGLFSGQEPIITYTLFGSSVSTRLTGSNWVDAGGQYYYTNPLSGSSQSQRWFAPASSGNVYNASRVLPVYYYQLQMTVSYSRVGDGGTPPTFAFTSFGGTKSLVANATGAHVWLDYSSAYSFTNPLAGSTPAERWATVNATGMILQSGALSPKYFHQFLVSPSYALHGTGSVKPPTLSYVSFNVPNLLVLPTAVSQPLWMDSGSRYSAANPLDGSSASERWSSPTSDGTVTSPQQPSFRYYHQFALGFNYSVVGGGSPGRPVLIAVQYGLTVNASLSSRTTVFWLDNSSSWSVSNTLGGSSSTERWVASVATGGVVSRSDSAGITFAHQYFVGIEFSPGGSGSVSPQSDWQNAGAAVPLVATPGQGWAFASWEGSGVGSYSGPRVNVSIVPLGPVVERASFFSGILLNSTDGGTVSFKYGQNSGVVTEGAVAIIPVPLGTNVTLRATPTSPFVKFDSWAGSLNSTAGQVFVLVNSPLTITANFSYDYVNMVVAIAAGVVTMGVGGTVLTRRRRRRGQVNEP